MKNLKYILVAVVCLGIGFFAGHWVQKERVIAQGVACTNKLKMIDSAKEMAAQSLKLTDGATVSPEQITPYLPGNRLPKCPAGGTYLINPLGKDPTCSLSPAHNCFHRCTVPD